MTSKVSVSWMGGMQFDADMNGHRIVMDATPDHGGNNMGTSPKPLLLASLAGCTGMDVASLLVKMRVEDYRLQIDIEGEQTDEFPMVYHTIHLHYRFAGIDLPIPHLLRAVELSQTRYCGVYAMLSKSSQIMTRIFVNGKEIA